MRRVKISTTIIEEYLCTGKTIDCMIENGLNKGSHLVNVSFNGRHIELIFAEPSDVVCKLEKIDLEVPIKDIPELDITVIRMA